MRLFGFLLQEQQWTTLKVCFFAKKKSVTRFFEFILCQEISHSSENLMHVFCFLELYFDSSFYPFIPYFEARLLLRNITSMPKCEKRDQEMDKVTKKLVELSHLFGKSVIRDSKNLCYFEQVFLSKIVWIVENF